MEKTAQSSLVGVRRPFWSRALLLDPARFWYPAETFGAMVVGGDVRKDDRFVQERVRYFGFMPRLALRTSAGDLYLRSATR
jgi:hypothetical protein